MHRSSRDHLFVATAARESAIARICRHRATSYRQHARAAVVVTGCAGGATAAEHSAVGNSVVTPAWHGALRESEHCCDSGELQFDGRDAHHGELVSSFVGSLDAEAAASRSISTQWL